MRSLLHLTLILISILSIAAPAAVQIQPDANLKSEVQIIDAKGGSFMMGAGDEQGKEKAKEELPLHKVTLNDFYIGQFEVTQALREKVMGSNPSKYKNPKAPVEQITWYDAVEFCNKLSLSEGLTPCYTINKSSKDPANKNEYEKQKWIVSCDFKASGYRLPAEAEWEYAARGGSMRKKFRYRGSNRSDEVGWHWMAENKKETYETGLKKPDELGIYDMSGKVGEFVWNCYGEYSPGEQVNPTGPASGSDRIGRGGSWYLYGNFSRVPA